MKKLTKYFFKKLETFFLWSSGADLEILKQVPIENNKFLGIGGTIIFTALMASFAGGYAFFTAFKDIRLSIPFGIFWGSLIFNLDRYIVTSFGIGDGKKTISGQELVQAAPRLVMAIILGFVISTPLELKLFEKEINAKIDTDIATVQNTIIKSGETDPQLLRLKTERIQIETDITNRTNQIEEKRKFWAKANQDKNDEWNTGRFSGKIGKGGYYDDLKKVADDAENDYNILNGKFSSLNSRDYARIDNIDKEIPRLEGIIEGHIQNRNTIQSQNDGLLARLKALSGLTKEENSLFFSKWLITLLFIFIEIAPILFKMMTERGPYDDIVDRIKHEHTVRQLEMQSNLNQEINTAVRIQTDKFEQKLNAELSANKDLLEAITQAQKEIAIVAIESWKEEQKEKMRANGSGIISSAN
jgi:hypothetical protein